MEKELTSLISNSSGPCSTDSATDSSCELGLVAADSGLIHRTTVASISSCGRINETEI